MPEADDPATGPASAPSRAADTARRSGWDGARPPAPLYAALDLGTNNCRLLIASPTRQGFRVVEAFSRIVRLGEGLAQTGALSEAAMDRAAAALKVCGERLRRRDLTRVQAVATQACRVARNGPEFLRRVERETGVRLRVIAAREEAQLSVAGCLGLLDRSADAALVVDVGGGSTELSWVDLRGGHLDGAAHVPLERLPIRAWTSLPVGVVTLAEQYPERHGDPAWFRAMVDAVKARVAAFTLAEPFRRVFTEGRAHLIGTSGAITSLAGLHLNLTRYERARVDGLWLSRDDCTAAAERLMALPPAERAAQPCIGPDRADLVLAGAAILQAVQETWPCERVRVADRGLREGLLLSAMAEARRGRRSPRPDGRARATAAT